MKKTLSKKGLTWVIIALLFSAAVFLTVLSVFKILNDPVDQIKVYLSEGNEKAAVEYYNSQNLSQAEKSKAGSMFSSYIAGVRRKWDMESPVENTLEVLSVLAGTDNTAVSESAHRHLIYITAEELLARKDYRSFTSYYNDSDIDPKDRAVIDSRLDDCILDIKEEWNDNSGSFYDCVRNLKSFTEINNEEASELASETMQYITAEEYLNSGSINHLALFYNSSVFPDGLKEELDTDIKEYIDNQVLAWSEERVKPAKVKSSLSYLSSVSDKDISDRSKESLDFINTESAGDSVLKKALALYHEKNYTEALKISSDYPENYSQSSALDSINRFCREELLSVTKNLQTVDEYSKSIAQLDEYIEKTGDTEFVKAKDKLKKELDEYRDVYSILMEATAFYENESYRQAFMKLKEGASKHPGDSKIKYAQSAFQYAYIVDVSDEVIDYTEQEEYDDARELLEDSIEIYDCDEFNSLLEEVKNESDFLYSTSARLSDTGYYIDKSGYKLLMDDFASDEEASILSLSGSLASTFLNADAPLDVRDLASDMSGWGNGEYAGARLALDAVGVKPLIGALKYAKHQDSVSSEENESSVKPIADAAKIINDVKTKASVIKEKSTEKEKTEIRYEPVLTVNQSLAGKKHPETGVKFVHKKTDLSDGRHISGVFPVFEQKYEMMLPKEYFSETESVQKSYISEELRKTADTPAGLKKLGRTFSADVIEEIKEGKFPSGYVIHYSEKEGNVQLVDKDIHEQTAHTEGIQIWGVKEK